MTSDLRATPAAAIAPGDIVWTGLEPTTVSDVRRYPDGRVSITIAGPWGSDISATYPPDFILNAVLR